MGTSRLVETIRRIVAEALGERDERDDLIGMYSDIYKEKHGIRPRHDMRRMADMPTEEIRAMLDALEAEPGDVSDDPPSDDLPVRDAFPGTIGDPEERVADRFDRGRGRSRY